MTIRLACLAASFILFAGLACAQQPQPSAPVALDIPASPLNDALKQLARQVGIQVVFYSRESEGLNAPRLRGTFTPQAALSELLAGTALRYEFVNANTVAIRSAKSADGKSSNDVSSLQETGKLALAQAGSTTPDNSAAAAGAQSEQIPAENAAETPAAKGVPEIVVSGSKILNMDVVRTLDDPQAYYVIDSKKIENSGVLDVDSFLKRNLSMNTTALTFGQTSGNTRGNISQINLRGVGSTQTLVLINGRRAAAASLNAFQPLQPNLNSIPVDAIERIEVLPSSSTGIYGGAAVGGVVNVVLKQNFDGGKINMMYGNTFSSDGEEKVVDATYGLSLEEGRTNIMVAAHYSESQSPYLGDRDLFSRGVQRILRNSPSFLSSGTVPYSTGATTNISSVNGSALVLKPEYGGQSLGSSFTHVEPGTSPSDSPLAVGASLLANAGSYDMQAPRTVQTRGLLNRLRGQPVSKSALATVRRQMTDRLELFAEVAKTENTDSSPVSQFNAPVTILASAPSNPFQQNVRVTAPVTHEGELTPDHESQRAAFGFIATLPADWRLQGDYTWNQYNFDYETAGGDVFLTSVAAINSGGLNPFVDTILFPMSLDATSSTVYGSKKNTLDDIGLRLSGPVLRLPGGKVALTIGLGHRKEGMDQSTVRALYDAPPASSNNYESIEPKQVQKVKSAYVETLIPLISARQKIRGVNELSLQAAVRTERYAVDAYSTVADSVHVEYSATKPMFGVLYRPVESVALRVSHSSSFLPPGFSQFFSPTLQPGLGATIVDPRRGDEVVAGIPFYIGGNPSVQPQESKDLSAGLILEPASVEGLRVSLDWYRLQLTNRLTNPTAQQMVDLELRFPGRVTRAAALPGDPFGVGSIIGIDTSVLSALELETEGLTAAVDYRFRTASIGEFDIAFAATKIFSFDQQFVIGEPSQDVLDQVAFGGPLSFKANFSLGWRFLNWQAEWFTTYYGSYQQYSVGGNQTYLNAQGGRSIESQMYHDAVVSYLLPAKTTVRLGVRNIFDSDPPFDAFYAGTAYTSPFGDVRLRSYWLQLSKQF